LHLTDLIMSFFNAAKQALNSSISNDRSYGSSQDDGNSQGDRQTGGQDYNSPNNGQGRQYSNDVSSSGYSRNDDSQDGRQTGGQDYNASSKGQGRQYSNNDVSSNNDSNNDGYSQDVRQTGGQQYNAPSNGQQPQGRYNTDDVLSHANSNDEDSGYISNAMKHVNDNSGQHQDQVSSDDMGTYGPMITKALSSVASKHGIDVNSLMAGATGQGGGNQLMGMVMKEAGNYASGGGAGGQDKQSLMNGAAMTLTKLAAQGQLSSFTGGSNSGGLSGMAANMGKSMLQNQFGQVAHTGE